LGSDFVKFKAHQFLARLSSCQAINTHYNCYTKGYFLSWWIKYQHLQAFKFALSAETAKGGMHGNHGKAVGEV
jgi:hypothetical protein